MKTTLKIARNELSTMFYSPIAWIVLIIFTLHAGTVFTSLLVSFLERMELGEFFSRSLTKEIFASSYWPENLFKSVTSNLFFYIPLLTMGLISKELSSGSIKLTLSSPVNFRQLVLGKYLAMVIYSLVLILVLVLVMIAGGVAIESLDYKLVISGLLGVFLLVCTYSAIGLYVSSFTSYQIVAAIVTMAIILVLSSIGWLWQEIPVVSEIEFWLALNYQVGEISIGLINSKTVFYFLIIIGVLITFTILKLSNKWKSKSKGKIRLEYALVLVIAFGIGAFSSNPYNIAYYDMTRGKTNTISPELQEVVSKLKEHPLKVTFYANLIDQSMMSSGTPRSKNNNYRYIFGKYTRFLPQLETDYVYYYDTIPAASMEYENKEGLYGEALAKRKARAYDIDFDRVLPPEEIREIVDLNDEENQYLTQITYNGKKAFLRFFDDTPHVPFDLQIGASLKQLVTKVPSVGFLTGHGERNLDQNKTDYGRHTIGKNTNRNSLLNQGFKFEYVSVEENDIPKRIDILVIADVKSPFTKEEEERVAKYITNGGNTLIMAEPTNRDYIKSIVNKLEVDFIPGELTQKNKGMVPSFIVGEIPKEVDKKLLSHSWQYYKTRPINLPGAVGFSYLESGKFKKWPLLLSEKETFLQNLNEDSLAVPTILKESIPLAVGLERNVNTKQQRIMIMGDADFMSNAQYTSSSRYSLNHSFIPLLFKWLSNDEFPPEVGFPAAIDNQFKVSKKGLSWINIVLVWIIPGLLLLVGATLLLIRKSK
ncbi:hypothetical protein LPB03_12080 [Polaribacter vadi]|uniref:ABC-type uncharacterized transport system domain-containing protein n=1 Tax=Polaribacter vadi TaxID=1774273 RepID=A0A1B8TTM0_9FLAO|nr:Gldg family protein [Polaribacter vadi]AOW18145.1 hypothetical protein LPB03_12080 [Polaribacter vadi]OBY62874.1 hypothetical protein LPB3_12095 [Polaribacter vadi]